MATGSDATANATAPADLQSALSPFFAQFTEALAASTKQHMESQTKLSNDVSAKLDKVHQDMINMKADIMSDIHQQTGEQIVAAMDPFHQVLEDLKNKVGEIDLKTSQLGEAVKANSDALAQHQAEQAKVSSDAEMDEGASQASAPLSQGKHKQRRTEPSASSGAWSRSPVGAPATPQQHNISTPRQHTPARPPTYVPSSDPSVPTPERIWINGFPFEVQPTIQQKHWDQIKKALPEEVQEQAKFEAKGLSTNYSVLFSTAAQATDAVATLRTKKLEWVNIRTKEVMELRANPDRTLRGRVAGRLVHSLWESLAKFLAANHPDKDWSVAQDKKKTVFVDVEGDAHPVFKLSMSKEGEVSDLHFEETGLVKIGMSKQTAQAAIDLAASMANRRQ